MATRHLVLMTQESATAKAVSEALASNGKLAPEDICRDLASLVTHLERTTAPAVLVDVDPDPPQQLAQIEPLVRRFTETRFVLLARELSPNLLLEAMHVGARHVLVKQRIAAELADAIRKVCPVHTIGMHGAVVTVLSAGGGCGATTVAVNLANEFRLASSETALVVDLDWAYGTVPTYLGAAGQFGMLDLLTRGGNVDAELIDTTVLKPKPELHVLAASGTSGLPTAGLQTGPRFTQALAACRTLYRYVVIDAPRLHAGHVAELGQHSDMILIVLQLTIKDIRIAKLMLQALLDAGVSPAAITPVVSRYRKRVTLLQLADVQRTLKHEALVTLSNDYPAAIQAIDRGEPLAETAPRSPLRHDLQALAANLHVALTERSRAVAAAAY